VPESQLHDLLARFTLPWLLPDGKKVVAYKTRPDSSSVRALEFAMFDLKLQRQLLDL
jgi:hypothetical protein